MTEPQVNDTEVVVTGRPQNLRKTSGRHAGVNWGKGWSVGGGLGEKLFEQALPLDNLFGSYKQIYGLPSFAYGGMVVSFAWRLHCTEEMHCLNHSLPVWAQCGTNCGKVYSDLAHVNHTLLHRYPFQKGAKNLDLRRVFHPAP